MGRTGAALILALAAATIAGCGSSSSTPTPTTTTASILVTPAGTGGFVPVGTSGVSISVPAGTIPQATTLSTIPITSGAAVGAPFPGSDSFITGLQFGSSISPLIQPAGFQVPIVQPIPAGTSVAVFELGRSGWRSIGEASSNGRFVTFTTDHPGTYVFVALSSG